MAYIQRHFSASTGIKDIKMSLLDKLKSLFKDQNAVGFEVSASQVQILQEPSHFYEVLLEKCRTAEKRIVLASLYLGAGQLEANLINTISQRISEKPELKVNVLLDCMRGSRGKDNSRTMLLPLIRSHPEAIKVSLYHTPKYRGVLKKLIPNRYNEIIGLQHMKLYLFDDNLIISGANLSNDYFTHRQDRYMVINNCRPLGDFVSGLCSKVADFSFQLDGTNQLYFNSSWPDHPVNSKLDKFVDRARNHVTSFYSNNFNNVDTERKSSGDTIIYPLLEMGQLRINQDSSITRKVLESCPEESEVRIATGYFNMTKEYTHSIIDRSKASFHILMAHPKANGFYEAKGPAGGIPKGYSELAGRFYDKVLASKQSNRVGMLEYSRPGWTFHSKGLWLSPTTQAAPILTLIGSPNFGERSVHHDLECQFVVATSNAQLQEALREEYQSLYRHGMPFTHEERRRKPPLWVKIVLLFFKTYL